LNPVETIINLAGGSVTAVARILTAETAGKRYYTVNQVMHWRKTGEVPAKHVAVVSEAFDLDLAEVAPQIFGEPVMREAAGRVNRPSVDDTDH